MAPDIRKWFVKAHKSDDNGSKPKKADPPISPPEKSSPATIRAEKNVQEGQESSGRRKTSKYFATDKLNLKNENSTETLPIKRKTEKDSEELLKSTPRKKLHRVDDVDDDDFVSPNSRKNSVDATPTKKLKGGSGRGIVRKAASIDTNDEECIEDEEPKIPVLSGGRGASVVPAGGRGSRGAAVDIGRSNEESIEDKDTKTPLKSGGRGRGGVGASGAPAGGRGRGGGRGGFMNFGERKDPPHKGEKEIPEGAPDCLAGFTFVISGTLDSLEREEAEDLIKSHGGRVTTSVSKKTNYLLCDEDIGGRKSVKAKELGTTFLTEDGLFNMIRSSNRTKAPAREESKKSVKMDVAAPPKKSPQKVEMKKSHIGNSSAKSVDPKGVALGASPVKRKVKTESASLTWTEKYKPKVPKDIVGNDSLVTTLQNWLKNWNEQFLNTGNKGKSKKQNDSTAKKAVLLCGTPGIGKTTSAKLVSHMLGFQIIEVNASDSRGKADAQIHRGIGGSTANSVKELVSNEALSVNMDRLKNPKTVLIMDEVDGMSAGDRGGVADLIASIKLSKIPIICICNDRYSQKLKSLVNYCQLLSFRKPTKQQIAKRLSEVANAEGLKVDGNALAELAERVNGDIRMALNQLQYMSLSMSTINYADVKQRLLSNAKNEDISPFTAVEKLLGFNGGRLKMDERIDLSMSDPDLVPLLIQENYMNYKPNWVGKDDDGMKRMNLIARAAESIGDGDIINVQIRRYRQWQLSQTSSLSSCIIPAALLHGQREVFSQGERNFCRFSGWLGKNSTMGKNVRLLEDLHVHLLASSASNLGRETLRADFLTLLMKRLAYPLRELPKDEAVKKVVELMDTYSISMEDFDTIVELSKFQGHRNPLDGIAAPVKAALTKAYKQSKTLKRTPDLISLPGIKKAPKKRIAAILEPVDDGLAEENASTLAEDEEESPSDTEDLEGSADDEGKKLQMDLQSLNSKGVKVQVELKGADQKKTPTRTRGGKSGTTGGRGGSATASASKRKR